MEYDWKILASGRRRAGLAGCVCFAATRRAGLAGCVGFAAAMAIGILPVPTAAADDAQSPPSVALDQLLELPPSFEIKAPRPGGATRAEWRDRFGAAHAEDAAAKEALKQAMGKLEGLASQRSNWNVLSPGAEAPQDGDMPLDYALKQEIRGYREEVERAERGLRELGVEANLAGVPEEWHSP